MKDAASFVQKKSLATALTFYTNAANSLVDAASKLYVQDMLKVELNTFDRTEQRFAQLRNGDDTGGYDGGHWYHVRIYSRTEWVGRVAPFKGVDLFYQRIRLYT